jgi:hypothetical protein
MLAEQRYWPAPMNLQLVCYCGVRETILVPAASSLYNGSKSSAGGCYAATDTPLFRWREKPKHGGNEQ